MSRKAVVMILGLALLVCLSVPVHAEEASAIAPAPPCIFFRIATSPIAAHKRKYASMHRPWIASFRMKYQGGVGPPR